MSQKITIGCDIAKRDDEESDCTVICAVKRKRRAVVLLDRIIIRPDNPRIFARLYDFNLKWHPNFLRRWLFRLFKL